MSCQRSHRHSGAAILMAVMLLVLLGMVGMSFVIVAHLDRREARSLAMSPPARRAAMGTLEMIRAALLDDLGLFTYGQIKGQGKQSEFPYERCESWLGQIDSASEAVNPWLASHEVSPPLVPPGVPAYRHVTNLFGNLPPGAGRFDNVPSANYSGRPIKNTVVINGQPVDRWLVDTDGDKKTDAVLVNTGVRDAAGNAYYVAVRIIDLSGLVNVNTVYGPSAPAPFNSPDARGITATDMDWTALGFSSGSRNMLHQTRCGGKVVAIEEYHNEFVRCPRHVQASPGRYYPYYGPDDALALLWREPNPDSSTSTMRGRLFRVIWPHPALPNLFPQVRPSLTTWSTSRLLPLQIPVTLTASPPDPPADYQDYKYFQGPADKRVDLNDIIEIEKLPAGQAKAQRLQGFRNDLLKAFFNAIPGGLAGFTDGTVNESLRKRTLLAAQAMLNAIDFADADDVPSVRTEAGEKLCGIERQPFITELFLKKFREAVDADPRKYSAIEMFNPYATPISLEGYRLRVGGALTGGAWPVAALGPKKRLVIRSSNELPVRTGTDVVTIAALDLSKDCEIIRQLAGGYEVHIGKGNLNADVTEPLSANQAHYTAARRDDREQMARYSVAVYHYIYDTTDAAGNPHDYTNNGLGGFGSQTPDNTNLGYANFQPADIVPARLQAVAPTPVYVRDGGFISLGDLLRLYYIGPGAEPLDEQLKADFGNVSNCRWDAKGTVTYTLDTGIWPSQIPQIPPACLFSEFLTVTNPAADGIDNDFFHKHTGTGVYLADDEYEKAVFGLLNINTAPRAAIRCLPYVTDAIADRIIAYRDAKDATLPAFATAGEVLIPIRQAAGVRNEYGPNYTVADGGATDDGLPPSIQGDLAKHQIVYSRVANLVTVRSDVFAAYISVFRYNGKSYDTDPTDLETPETVSRFVAILDRSQCFQRGSWPEVLLFAAVD